MLPKREEAERLLKEAARICLTHFFHVPDIRAYIGNFDITQEQQQEIQEA